MMLRLLLCTLLCLGVRSQCIVHEPPEDSERLQSDERWTMPGKCVEYDHGLRFYSNRADSNGTLDYALCKDVVDYEYFLDDLSYGQEEYEHYMRFAFKNDTVASLVLPLLDSRCQGDFKKIFCANHFRRCETDVEGNAYPLRVCPSMLHPLTLKPAPDNEGYCEEVALFGGLASVPLVLAAGAGKFYVDAESHIYSTAEEEAAGECTLIEERPPVQSTTGNYTSELCDGLITEYFVPPTIHPFQPPGLAEEFLEAIAYNISLEGLLAPFGASPIVMPGECQAEWKKFACGAAFMEVEKAPVFASSVNLDLDQAVLLNVPLPKFLSRTQCNRMTTACSAFIDFAAAALDADLDVCGAVVNQPGSPFNGIDQFPDSEMHELVSLGGPDVPLCAQINLPYAGIIIDLKVDVSTKTRVLDYEPYASFTRELACPPPLVVPPPDKADRGVFFTGCAIPCPQPYWPPETHDIVKWYLILVTVVSFVTVTFTVATFAYFKRLRKQRQTLIFSL